MAKRITYEEYLRLRRIAARDPEPMAALGALDGVYVGHANRHAREDEQRTYGPKPKAPAKKAPAKKAPAKKAPAKKAPALGPMPKPLRFTDHPPDPYEPPSPRRLAYVYGERNVRRALHEYGMEKLKELVAQIHARLPKTTLPDRRKKAAVIDYIMRYWKAAGV